jgi:glycosyltransferase involved in cell wall biosynthesis
MNQTFTDWEYLIIDDHSNDDSMNVISEYISLMPLQIQKKIKVLRNDENIGLPSCSNKALTRARGNFIVRVDSDDRLHSEYLARTIEAIKLNECHAALSGYCRTNEKLETLNEILVNEWNPACALISRSAANEIKYRDSVKFCEGDIFFADFRKYYKHTFITATLWDYRERPGQKTKDPQHPKNLECANYG